MTAMKPAEQADWQKPPQIAAGLLSGVPLDMVKIMAAVLMLVDHAHDLLLGNAYPWLYLAGRGAFPLFCWAVAAALLRAKGDGAVFRQAALLLGFAFASEIASQWARPHYDVVNVLFTLALAAALAPAVLRLPAWGRMFVYAAAFLLTGFSGAVEFNMAGTLLPVALAGAIMGLRVDLAAAILLAGVMNFSGFYFYPMPAVATASVAAAATLWPLGLLWLVSQMKLSQRGRLVPRYALHVFYPLHMVVLAAIRRLF